MDQRHFLRLPLTLLLIGATFLLAVALAPGQAGAAYPGEPGPIVYKKYEDKLIPEGESLAVHPEGGLVLHGPRRTDPPRALTDDWGDANPAFSPDGRLVAFNGDREPQGPGIYAMHPDGSGLRFLTQGGNPYFSPDGRRLVFTRGPGETNHLFVLRIATGAVRQLTFGAHHDGESVFTPNGRRILFSSDRASQDSRDRTDIWQVPAGGGKPRLLVDGPRAEVHPEVAPSGRLIAYVVEQSPYFGFGDLRIARSNGSFVRSLDEKRGPQCRPCYGHPAWAPDGRHLVAAEKTDNVGGSSVMAMRPDGSHRRQFDSGTVETEGVGGHVSEPTWGPASR